jgi:plastocyanin
VSIAPRAFRTRAPFALVLVVAAFVAGCGGGAPGTPVPVPSGALVIKALDSQWQPAAWTAPSAGGFQLYFDNADTLPHNVVFQAADGTKPFSGDVFTGKAQKVYDVPALASGSYKVLCDVHPNMVGTLTVP